MKTWICLAGLCALLLLGSGCSAMLERSYGSTSSHADYYPMEEDPSVLQAETYQGLVNSILYFVESHITAGTIRLYNYTGDVESDLASACSEILTEDPLGAYAVRDIRYDTTRIVTYYEVNLSVIYARSAQDVESIRSITGLTGLRSELRRVISSLQTHAAIRASYFSWTDQFLTELFWATVYSQPCYAVSGLEMDLQLYPDSGTQRIIELSLSWPQNQEDLSTRAAQLTADATGLLSASPPQGETYTPQELAGLLATFAVYSPEGSSDPADGLQGRPVNDLGLLLTYELLCQEGELDAEMALGALGQEQAYWLILETAEGYRHLPAQELVYLLENPQASLSLYTDERLSLLGYSWQANLYPVCSE